MTMILISQRPAKLYLKYQIFSFFEFKKPGETWLRGTEYFFDMNLSCIR